MDKGGNCPPPAWKYCKAFCALVVTVKRSVDQLFMHIFTVFIDFWGRGFTPGFRWKTFVSRLRNLLTLEKNPTGAHAFAGHGNLVKQ